MSHPYLDRTAEFRSAVESAAFRAASSSTQQQQQQQPLVSKQGRNAQRTEFARMAAKIGKDIQGTTGKLEKLAQLAKRKTLFDDRPVEISELTYIIKQDIAALNQQIAQLQAFTLQSNPAAAGAGGKQVSEHNKNVVTMLQSKLADTTIGFKDVLEIRTQNMKASRDRTEQFAFSGPSNPRNAPPSDSPLYRPSSALGGSSVLESGGKGKGKAGQSDFTALEFGAPTDSQLGAAEGGYMQMEMAQQQGDDQYLSSRSTAIETIESTVAELGQIFSQLAHMVAVQGEQVTRIDTDTEDIAANVTGAQSELLRYYASVSSNRWLMMKVFAVLIVFFLVFVLVS